MVTKEVAEGSQPASNRVLNALAEAARRRLIGYDFARDAKGAWAAIGALLERGKQEPAVAAFCERHLRLLAPRPATGPAPPPPRAQQASKNASQPLTKAAVVPAVVSGKQPTATRPPESPRRQTTLRHLVSIIVTARNYGHFLRDCLLSCKAQRYPQVEIIYSDDGSTDNSVAVAAEFEGVKIVRSKKRQGVVKARNLGAAHASGDIFIFLDGDDLLTPDYVAQKVAALTPEHSVAYGAIQEFGASTARREAAPWTGFDGLLRDNCCESASAIWRHVFHQAGGYQSTPQDTLEDWHLWLRAARIAPPTPSGSTMLYRRHSKSKSQTIGFARPGGDTAAMLDEIRSQFRGDGRYAKQPLRVGFVFPQLHLGGAQQWLLSLLRHLPGDGQVICSGVALTRHNDNNPAWIDRAAQLARIHSSGILHSRATCHAAAKQAAQAVAAASDVLVCWCNEPLADLLGDFAGPVVLVSHGAGEWSQKLLRPQEGRATHFAACSLAAAGSFSRGVSATVLHNGAEPDRCKPQRTRASVRKEWGVSPKEIAVAHIGRLYWDKNPLAVAMAVAELGAPCRAVYVGGGLRKDDIRNAVSAMVDSPVFQDETEDVGSALAATDCFVLASPSEGFSLGLIEAWLAGVPVVATRVGAIPEIEAIHGPLVVPVSVRPSPSDLAAAVKQAMSVRNKARIAKAQRVARDHFTAAKMADRWRGYLMGVAGR